MIEHPALGLRSENRSATRWALMPTPPPFATSAPLICLNAASAKPADVRVGRDNGARMLRRPSQLTSVGCRQVQPRQPSLRWSNRIRTAGPILVFIDRGGRFETNTDGIALVDIGAFADDPPHDPRGVNIAAISTALRGCRRSS